MAATRHQALGLAQMAARNGTSARPAIVKARFVDDGSDWREQAACRDVEDKNLFYPISYTGGPALLQVEDAKRICFDCPSRHACLAFAIKSGDSHGILGGTTPDERAALKRREQRANPRKSPRLEALGGDA